MDPGCFSRKFLIPFSYAKDISKCVPFFLFLRFIQDNQGWKAVTKNKMDNPTFDEEDIPMVNQDEEDDYDYRTPNTSRMNDTSFTVPDTTETTSTTQL